MKKRVIVTLGVAMVAATIALPGTTFATDKQSEKPQEHKITLCHANHSATGNSGNQPYVQITVDYHAVTKGSGHGYHTGPVASTLAEADTLKKAKIHWGDIIPPLEAVGYQGLNWNTKGKAIYNHHCQIPTLNPSSQPNNPTTKPADTPATAPVKNPASTPLVTAAGITGQQLSSDTTTQTVTPQPTVTHLPETGGNILATALALGATTAIATAAVRKLQTSLQSPIE